MAKFIVDLTDEQRALLEAYRRRTGERSLSDAVRLLIKATDLGKTDAGSRDALRREGGKFQADMDAATAAALDIPLGNTRKALQKGAKR